MNKLMMSAVAAMTVGICSADVTSANVVGYANDAMAQGVWRPICSQFKTVGTDGSTMTFKDLKVDGVNWKQTSNGSLKIITANATLDYEAWYVSAQNAMLLKKLYPNIHEGWWKLDYSQCLDDEPLPFGTAVLGSCSVAGGSITTSGEVAESETGRITFDLAQGAWTWIGNCTPVPLKLKDFKVDGVNWKQTSNGSLKFITANATLDYEAWYVSAQNAMLLKKLYPNIHEGWWKLDYSECLDELDILPGRGILASCSVAGGSISIPSAL